MSAVTLQPTMAVPVTPGTSLLEPPSSALSGSQYAAATLYIGTSGDLSVETEGGQSVVFSNVPVGFFPVKVVKVFSLGTSATDIIALW